MNKIPSGFEEWLRIVLQNLSDTSGQPLPLFQASIEHPDNPMKFEDFKVDIVASFDKFRGDEPLDAFLGNKEARPELPEEYAKFLMDEWELFGPGGE